MIDSGISEQRISGDRRKRVVLAVTGASGAAYARRLLEQLVVADVEVHLIVSSWGRVLFHDELGIEDVTLESLLGDASLLGRAGECVTVHPYKDVGSTLASGSFLTDAMVICPCSSHTLGEISAGIGNTLISRAAAVTLKERRLLVLVPRETPTGHIDLLNMVRLSEAGAVICPASPGFYLNPTCVDDLVDFMVGKILDLVGVSHELNTRWEAMSPDEDQSRIECVE